MVARDYSPATGTFTSLDSVQGGAANPLTMNRYLYALANPATLVDPDGHAACLDEQTSCRTVAGEVLQAQKIKDAKEREEERRKHQRDLLIGCHTRGSHCAPPLPKVIPPRGGWSNMADGSTLCFTADCVIMVMMPHFVVWAELEADKAAWDEFVFQQLAMAPLMVLPMGPITEGAPEVKAGDDLIAAATAAERAALLAAREAQGLPAATGNLWRLNPLVRGRLMEPIVRAARAMRGALPGTFPGIDNFDRGVATSIKSLNLGSWTYRQGGPILNKLSGYVDELAQFSGGSMVSEGVPYTVQAGSITQRVLSVAVPPSATAEQVSAIAASAEYAQSQGITMVITVIR
jgi:hypothetical protein